MLGFSEEGLPVKAIVSALALCLVIGPAQAAYAARATPTASPTASPTSTPSPTATSSPTPTPVPTPTPSPTPEPIALATYAFTSQIVYSSSASLVLTTVGNPDAQFNIPGFLATWLADFPKKCALTAQGLAALKTAISALKKTSAGTLAGDTTSASGTITFNADSGAIVGGLASFSSTTTSASGKAVAEPNVTTQALLCGGQPVDSGTGTCGSVCTSSRLRKGRPLPEPQPSCVLDGGGEPFDEGLDGYSTIFMYPLANANGSSPSYCTGPANLTWAECCNDPNLVVIINLHDTYSKDHSRITSVITDEGDAGLFTAEIQ